MRLIISKVSVCGLLTAGFYCLAELLVIPPLLPTGVAAWGSFCFLFASELSGAKIRIRNGVEEKPVLQIMWMVAGLLCILLAVGVLFFQI